MRTLYYRLLRLLALSIQPLFVFDGPHKPPFKRGRKIASSGACLPNFLAKELLKRFGYPYHTAPGEAEAECALLQRENIVDAVLSEDVDTMMFGCSMTMRTWTAEGVRGNKSPTHVNLYKAESIKEEKGFDSEGMILIALMSGGDYIPAGIAGCGIKIAYEAAKAGFGRDLCQLSKNDTDGITEWRERLERELQTNESKYFRQKHKAMKIPTTFPDKTVLAYYMHPAISSREKVAKLRDEIKWDLEVNVTELRMFVAEAFDWQYLSGAKKFVRGLAPALLAHQLVRRSKIDALDEEDVEAKERAENKLVKCICGRRNHWNTGGEPELRVAYIPSDIVGLDLDSEEKGDFQGYGQDVSGDDQPASEGDQTRDRSQSPAKRRGPSTYDPAQIEKIWVLETHVKLGVPLLAETWEEEMRNSKKFASRKAREKAKTTTSEAGTDSGALDQYVRLTKPRSTDRAAEIPTKAWEDTQLPPTYLAPVLVNISTSQQRQLLAENIKPIGKKAQKQKLPAGAKTKRTRNAPTATQTSTPPKDHTTNPWTLAKRTPENPSFKSPPRHHSQEPGNRPRPYTRESPTSTTSSPSTKNLHSRPSTPISEHEDQLHTRERTPHAINKNVTIRKSKPSRHDPTKPSPRKKRSPLQMANELFLAGQLRTPTTGNKTRTEDALATTTVDATEPLTSQKVNRKLDFTAQTPITTTTSAPPSPAPSDSSSLPSPSTLLFPAEPPPQLHSCIRESNPEQSQSISKVLVQQLPGFKDTNARKLIALRESLEGAWKHLEPWEVDAGSRAKKVFRSVEVVDLTGG